MIASIIGEIPMKLHTRDPGSFTSFCPIGLNAKTWKDVEPIFEALKQAQHETGRYSFYGYLVSVYRTYKKWKDSGTSKSMSRNLAKHLAIPRRKGTSPVRMLIDATFPALESKQKSRWTRALEFAALTNTHPDDLARLFKRMSGIAGCARFAAKRKPKKNRYRNDWA
jgi:hypothetical protein